MSEGSAFGFAVLADGVGVGVLVGCVFFGVGGAVGVLVDVFARVVVTVGLGVGSLGAPDLLSDAEGWCLAGVTEGVAWFFGLAVGAPVCLLLPLAPSVSWVDGVLIGATCACSGSHDVLLAVAVALAAAEFAAKTMVALEAAVASTVPAISVTVARRACPKRMKRPT